jgi:nicotinamidase-related amidase
MTSFELDDRTSALVLIDLQRGIVARPVTPHTAAEVVARATRLAERFRERGAPVILVHVLYSPDDRDRLQPRADTPAPSGPFPADFGDILPEVGPRPGDIVITKRQWGAFHGTELELQLRRRGVRTIVLGGISTNVGVESTARDAYERGFDQVFVEDAMSSLSAEAHAFVLRTTFPRIGLVRSTEEVLAALGAGG